MNIVNINKRISVLVAEDDDTNYFFIYSILSRANVELYRAVNGREAIEICRDHPEIQLVFMDIKMPEVDGIEATIAIKAMRPSLTIIAQTAYVMQEDKEKALQAGCDGILPKPIKKADMLAYLDKYWEQES
ncbi:MAG TPA: response regulator [Bacteroidales bacterium]|nr:MAG: Polar-differentiation response regulator DivK [Bacteroidetes bacterium ADurb.Bin217]HOS83328.1 response regulator [Bacteroidales bacterium]HPH16433.1 response regulator [Bacteroidales bacterium]HPM13450.1 response regulator [Bacteroidales bacterium]